MWMRYLIAGAALAVTRVVLLVWLIDRLGSGWQTETEYLLVDWLYPEFVVSPLLSSFVSLDDGLFHPLIPSVSVVTIGSFVLATPILFVRWLRQRNLIVQIALCGLTIPAVTALLLVVVRLFRLDE